MNIAQAILSQYPNANPLVDFRVQDDSDGNGAYIAYWNVTDANGNPVPQPTTDELQTWWLTALKSQKITQLRAAYESTLASGFQETVSDTVYTFGWRTSFDEPDLTAMQKAIDKGFQTFPVQYADVRGNPISIPDQATLDNIEHTATNFAVAQHQQVLALIGDVQSAADESAIDAITWSPATYTQI